MFTIFKKTRELEAEIGKFLDTIIEASIHFKEGMKYYLQGNIGPFEEKVRIIDKLESRADDLRRSVEENLYLNMLLPEARGDVLALLENSDDVLNAVEETIIECSVEKPECKEELKQEMMQLVEAVVAAVDEMVSTVRDYFTNLSDVPNHITKLKVHEHETDEIGERMRRKIFRRDDLDLCQKMQLRDFVLRLEKIADLAEDVGDRVDIYRIKRLV